MNINTIVPNADAVPGNDELFAEIMRTWNCSALEAYAAETFYCETLEDTREAIAQAVTYERLRVNLFPEALRFMREEQYPDMTDESFLQREARELVEDEAWMFVYDWKQYDDYDSMTEAEIEAVI
jgi:hypothetical protein